MQAYSEFTNRHYDSWDDLVRAEAHGYSAVAVITNGRDIWTVGYGLFPTKKEAQRLARNQRARWKRQQKKGQWPDSTFSIHVAVVWKTDPATVDPQASTIEKC